MHITFGPFFSLKNVSHVKIQNGGHFKDGGNLRHIFGSFGISLDLLSDFYDINTVSYNGKEQIVSKAKSGTHVRVHV